jgi:nitrite reductase (NADH) large subunit
VLPEDPLEVLCQVQRGAAPAGERVVCNCHKVTVQTLRTAIENGADTLPALCETTKAGTGCGSCKTELGQLITSLRKPVPLEAAS